jgi:hypothetical protein
MPRNAGAWIKQKSSQKRKKYRTFFWKSLFDKVKSFSEEISKILRLCFFGKVKFYSGFFREISRKDFGRLLGLVNYDFSQTSAGNGSLAELA